MSKKGMLCHLALDAWSRDIPAYEIFGALIEFRRFKLWIPAYAGMKRPSGTTRPGSVWIPAYAGMMDGVSENASCVLSTYNSH